MDLKELYDSIDNTLSTDNVNTLINIYTSNRGNLYNGISRYYSKNIPEYNKKYINKRDKDLFFSNCFNLWKKNVLSISKDEFNRFLKYGSYERDFIKLRNYLLHVPDINSYEEMIDLYYGDNTPDDIKELFEKYEFSAIGQFSGWEHINSRYLNAKRTRGIMAGHRLYINTDSISLYKFLNLFVKKCFEKDIPFYFKFGLDDGNRDDTVPIYSDTEHLLDFIEIVKDIKKNNPDINFYEPPILSGKIDNIIGYGSEPDQKIIGKNDSFNNLRADIITDSIERCRNNWIKKNINRNFGTKDKPRSIGEYFTIRCVNNYVDRLIRIYDGYINMEKKNHNSNQSIEEVVYNKLHYTPEIVNSINFKNKVYRSIYNNVNNNIHNDLNSGFSVTIDINGKGYSFHNGDFKDVLVSFTSLINKNDSSFKDIVKEDIRRNCTKYGIIPDKFSFDRTRVQNMIEIYNFRKKATIPYTPLTDKEIEEARKDIGEYKEPKPRYTREELERIILGDDPNEKKDTKIL